MTSKYGKKVVSLSYNEEKKKLIEKKRENAKLA